MKMRIGVYRLQMAFTIQFGGLTMIALFLLVRRVLVREMAKGGIT